MPKIKWGQVAIAYLIGSFFGIRDLMGSVGGVFKGSANGRAA